MPHNHPFVSRWSPRWNPYVPERVPGPSFQELSQGCTLAGCSLFFFGILLMLCSGILLLFL